MPRVAALCGVNQISDIMEVNSAESFKRPVYAGNAIVQAEPASGAKVVATVRTASWKAADSGGSAEHRTAWRQQFGRGTYPLRGSGLGRRRAA